MRLLRRKANGELSFQTFENDIPPYAILSHTWHTNHEEEVTLQDVETGEMKHKIGFQKNPVLCKTG